MRALLSATLLLIASSKIGTGYEPQFSTPQWAYWASTVLEVIGAAAILTKWSRAAIHVVVVLCAGVIMRELLIPSGTAPCGCAGSIQFGGGRTALVLASGLGILAAATSGMLRWERAEGRPHEPQTMP